jgi:Icc-related predicted phosphoesterase
MDYFIKTHLFTDIKRIAKKTKKKTRFFVILGNDDPRMYEHLFIEAEQKGFIEYLHEKTVSFGDKHVSGYAYVPPTPFRLKDWERYDVSRYVDVGAISPEHGVRTVEVPLDVVHSTTIADDLERLSANAPVENTIFLFHAPPYDSYLDRADLGGKKVDHAPVDVHIGSIAIQRFIQKKQPFLTLHGHVHESARLTGKWKEKIGRTYSFSAAHDGPELAVVRFDTDDLPHATRELIDAS